METKGHSQNNRPVLFRMTSIEKDEERLGGNLGLKELVVLGTLPRWDTGEKEKPTSYY